MIACVHEDRPRATVGIRLLALSLERHCPGLNLIVSAPNATEEDAAWLHNRHNVELIDIPELDGEGWNAKPVMLRRLLDMGHGSALWMDSDIVAHRDFRHMLDGLSDRHVVVSQAEYWDLYQEGSLRAELWGLRVGRSLPYLASSGFLLVTSRHAELLEAYRILLNDQHYRRVQRLHQYERPVHMIGDQDVLTALLASARFSDLPIRYIKRGGEMALTVGPPGYTIMERLANLGRGLPPLIHCGGLKPWDAESADAPPGQGWSWYDRWYMETCPYAWVARSYREDLGNVANGPIVGLDPEALPSRLCRALTFDSPNMQGMPQTVFHTIAKRLKHALGKRAWPSPDSNIDPSHPTRGEELLGELGESV